MRGRTSENERSKHQMLLSLEADGPSLSMERLQKGAMVTAVLLPICLLLVPLIVAENDEVSDEEERKAVHSPIGCTRFVL